MTVEKLELKSNPGATLTAYLLDTSKEMPNMKERPAVLVIPGGGYYMCSDREAEPIAMAFAVHGYNTFVLRYTVGEGKDFKMPLADAEEALTLIRERAEEWHVIKDKIAAIGFSAGAHLAAALSTLSSTRPNACILGYPCILSEISSILAFHVPSLDLAFDVGRGPAEVVPAPSLFLSHAHLDHAGGLAYWASQRRLLRLPLARVFTDAEAVAAWHAARSAAGAR